MNARRLVVLWGPPEVTRAEAERRLAGFPTVVFGSAPLGTEADAVVLSLHEGLDPDALGRAVGMVRGGGLLVLCLPVDGPPPSPALATWPYDRSAVGTRLRDRLVSSLPPPDDAGDWVLGEHVPAATAEQDAVVTALVASAPGTLHTVIGARGRGKSAAIGLAAHAMSGRIAMTSLDPDHTTSARRFAPDVPWVDPTALARDGAVFDTVFVDEASAVPVPLLKRLVEAHPHARWVFATTVHGYEGTGRGFVHRFLPWLRGRGRVAAHVLTHPIRWAPEDPVEAWAARVLLLDTVRGPVPHGGVVRVSALDRSALAGDEALLRDVFGLLVEAHYRTTPADLARVLDAPNLALHAATAGTRVVGVALVAEEGGLPPELVAGMRRGERLRGHALPETLVSHAGVDEAGALRWLRSVRLVTEPAWRGQGVARALVAHVEAAAGPDGFGTLFGATAELVRFRRALGYLPVRLAASRGARSGEPSVVLVKPRSPAAVALVHRLRADLARDLPAQVALGAADGGAPYDPDLLELLFADLPPPSPVDPTAVHAFLAGRPYEAAVTAIEALVAGAELAGLAPGDRALVVGRVVERRAWTSLVASPAQIPSAMRAFRRAIASLVPSPERDATARPRTGS